MVQPSQHHQGDSNLAFDAQNVIPDDYENFESEMLNELQSSTTNSKISPLYQNQKKPKEVSKV